MMATFNIPLAAIVNYIHTAGDNGYMSENAIGGTTTTAVVPLALRNATFVGRGGWYTGLNIQNAGSSAAHPNVYYYDSSGNLLLIQVTPTASPNGSVTIYPLPSALGDGFMGSAWITSDQPIAVSATNNGPAGAGEDDAFAYAAPNS